MHAHPELLSAFSAGLINGTLPPGVTCPSPAEAARRFAVYRNNVSVGLTDALAKRFPVVKRLVGSSFFGAMAQVYVNDHRPKSPVLFEWGDSFPAFLEAFPPLAAYPYMADVARIELARGRAYHAADADPITPDRLLSAAAEPASARLGLHPSVQVLSLAHPAVSIWTANQPGMQPGTLAGRGPETALVMREASFAVPVIAIGPGDATLISAIGQGETLLAAAGLSAFAEHGHDPQPMLVRLMQAGVIIPPKDTPCLP